MSAYLCDSLRSKEPSRLQKTKIRTIGPIKTQPPLLLLTPATPSRTRQSCSCAGLRVGPSLPSHLPLPPPPPALLQLHLCAPPPENVPKDILMLRPQIRVPRSTVSSNDRLTMMYPLHRSPFSRLVAPLRPRGPWPMYLALRLDVHDMMVMVQIPRARAAETGQRVWKM